MAAIAIPHNEPTIVARWAFRALLDRLLSQIDDEADRYTVRQALALDGLHFARLDGDQAARLAKQLAKVADELRLELLRTPSDDERDQQFAEILAVLEMQLHDVYE
jgi:hypothetical protein